MQAFSKQASGTLRFSVSYASSEYFLNNFIIPFAIQQPQINFQFHNATVMEQLKQLNQGLIDFGFANAPLPHSEEITAVKIKMEYFYAVYSKKLKLPWSDKTVLTPSALQDLPLCCNYGSYSLLRSVCQSYGFQPKISFISTTSLDAVTFAASGLGIAIVAALPNDPVNENMLRLPIDDSKLTFSQSLYWSNKNRLSPAAELFLKFFYGREF